MDAKEILKSQVLHIKFNLTHVKIIYMTSLLNKEKFYNDKYSLFLTKSFNIEDWQNCKHYF